MDEEHIFTLAEAQSLLPRLRTLLGELGREWKRISELNPEIQKARENAPLNGYSKFGVEYVESVSHLMSLIHEIIDLGVLLKDADKGLCDFPYIRDGRMVYLCWQLGEDTIRYWHDVETGFAGREPLEESDT
ncbi:MAG: DUF2203 domain-containing protein [Acidobacteria bacterium]|nr:MAG: DUF2203 domain-containing protein [Acidobacteriota bacterium]